MTTSILFSKTKSPISRFIRWITKSEASHCAFLYYDGDFQCMMVMEADWYGFGLIPFTRWRAANTVIDSFPMELDEGLRYVAREYIGSLYDYGGAIGTMFVRFLRFLGRKVKNPLHASRSVFCSEAAVIAMQKQGIAGADLLDPAATTPGDLLNFLRWHTLS